MINIESSTKEELIEELKKAQSENCILKAIIKEEKREDSDCKNKEKYQILFDSANDAIFILDKYIIIDCNKKALEMFECTRDEIIGHSPYELSPSNQSDMVNSKEKAEKLILAANSGIPQYFEWTHKKKNGTEFFVDVSLNKYPIEKEFYFQAIIRDISEKKLALKKLQDSEERYKQLAEIFPEVIFECDLKGDITYSNDIGLQKFGYSTDDIKTGLNIINLIAPEDRERVLSQIQKRIKNLTGGFTEYKPLCKDGRTFYALAFSTPVIQNGKVLGIRGFILDITKRKEDEEDLYQRKIKYKNLSAQLEAILDHIPGPVFYKDKKNNFIRVNKNLADAHNKKKEELEGVNLADIYPKEDAEKYYLDDLGVINSGFAKLNIEEPWMTENGLRWVNTNKIPFKNEKGIIIGIIGISFDITDRKQAEIEIHLKNNELAKTNSEKDKFFSIIAHDLKGPFSGIVGLSELLVDLIKEKDYDQIENFANIIVQTSYHIMELLQNLMEWAQSQTGRINYNPVYFEISDVCNDVVNLFAHLVDKKSQIFALELHHCDKVFADKAMISTILRNLISNAIKFTNVGGKITISAETTPTELLISVCDTGIGMHKNAVDKLFKIDECHSKKGTQEEQGTGLGLILCKEFIEKHNGKIWVESQENKGSTFYFTIPINLQRNNESRNIIISEDTI